MMEARINRHLLGRISCTMAVFLSLNTLGEMPSHILSTRVIRHSCGIDSNASSLARSHLFHMSSVFGPLVRFHLPVLISRWVHPAHGVEDPLFVCFPPPQEVMPLDPCDDCLLLAHVANGLSSEVVMRNAPFPSLACQHRLTLFHMQQYKLRRRMCPSPA